jgi:carbohydrate-binding DOMON domain-containing protein
MSTQYRLVQSGKTASGGCSAGQGSSEPVAPQIYLYFIKIITYCIQTRKVSNVLLLLHNFPCKVQEQLWFMNI